MPLVLLVDDSEDARDIYRDGLAHHGLRVETAASGPEALTKARTLLPDVVVLDLGLPAMGGLDVCRQLKDDPRTATIPVIVLSGRDPVLFEAEARAAGGAAYLFKPVPAERLHAEIIQVLDQVS